MHRRLVTSLLQHLVSNHHKKFKTENLSWTVGPRLFFGYRFLTKTKSIVYIPVSFACWCLLGTMYKGKIYVSRRFGSMILCRVATKLSRQNSMTFPWPYHKIPWPLNRHIHQLNFEMLLCSSGNSFQLRICLNNSKMTLQNKYETDKLPRSGGDL